MGVFSEHSVVCLVSLMLWSYDHTVELKLNKVSNKVCESVCADKPRFGREHPRGRPRDVHIWAGRSHNITCHVHAYPEPEIEWLRDDRRLTNNGTFTIHVSKTHSNLEVWLISAQFLYTVSRTNKPDLCFDLLRETVFDINNFWHAASRRNFT